jgi:hypothetical protein
MIPPQRYFPWKVARQIFFSNLAVMAAVLVMAGFSLRIRVYETFMNGQDLHDSLSRFDSYITSVLFTMFGIAAVLFAVRRVVRSRASTEPYP